MSDTIQLEKLEIAVEVTTDQVQKQLEKIAPQVERAFGKIKRITRRSSDRTEQNLDFGESTSKMTQQFERLNTNIERMMKRMEKTTDRVNENFEKMTAETKESMQQMQQVSSKTSKNVSRDLSKGFKQARSKVNKDVELMVNDINNSMAKARVEQQRLMQLKDQRQQTILTVDDSAIIKVNEQIAKAQSNMLKNQGAAKNAVRLLKEEFENIPNSLDQMALKMEQNRNAIERQRKQVQLLNEEYEKQRIPTSLDPKNPRFADTEQSLKTLTKIQKQQAEIDKLVSQNDHLAKAYVRVEKSADSLSHALERVNTDLNRGNGHIEHKVQMMTRAEFYSSALKNILSKLGQSGRTSLGKITNGLSKMKGGLERAKNAASKFGGLFNRTSNSIAHGSKRANNGIGNMSRTMSNLMRRMIVFNLMRNGIMRLSRGFVAALRTNEQFEASLNQIQVSLLTAFYPIFTTILPAINALMSALAQATTVFASFVATLFGTTFEAARNGAQGLYENIKGVGEAAEETQRALMGFDEINRIGLEEESGLDFGAVADPGVAPWMLRVKELLADFFQPFRNAWDRYGYRVMREWQHMLREVTGLAKAIGRSFMEVWTNGTGERFLGNILKLVANVLGIVGDIARAFRIAWEEGDRGTALIQSLFNKWNALLELINVFAITFRDVWNDGTGVSIASHLLEIFTNINNTIANLINNFRIAWETNEIGERIMRAILGIIDDILGRINNVTLATKEWASSLDFTPLLNSIASLLEAIRPLTDRIGEGLEWFFSNVLLPLANFTITRVIPSFLELLSSVLNVLTAVIDALRPLASWFWDSFLQPLASWTGGAIISIIEGLTNKLEAFAEWCRNNQQVIELVAIAVGSFVVAWKAVSGIIAIITGLKTILGLISVAVKGFGVALAILKSPVILAAAAIAGLIIVITSIARDIDLFETGANLIRGLLDGIMSIMSSIGNWIRENIFEPIVGGFKRLFRINSPSKVFEEFGGWLIEGLMRGISNLIMGPINLITGLWTGIRDGAVEWGGKIRDRVSESWGNIRDNITDRVSQARENVTQRWDDIRTRTSDTFNNVKDNVRDRWNDIGDSIRERATSARDNVRNRWDDIRTRTSSAFNNTRNNASRAWNGIRDNISDTARNAADSARDRWTDIRTNTSNRFNEVRNNVSSRWSEIGNSIATNARSASDNARTRFEDIRRNVTDRANQTRTNAVSAWRTLGTETGSYMNDISNQVGSCFDAINSKARSLGSTMADGLRAGATALRNGARDLGRGLIDGIGWAINSVVSGANWILGRLGSNRRVANWVPHFANGTGPGGHKGGLMVVGDGGMEELVVFPNGQSFLSPNTDTLVNAPKGTEVVSGPKTKTLLSDVPHFSRGTGGFFSNMANIASGAFNRVRDWSTAIWDWVRDRTSIRNLLANNIGDMPARFFELPADILRSGVSSTIGDATNFLFSNSRRYVNSRNRNLRNNDGAFENGGLINQEGLYRLGERNLNELIIPLDKPNRAMQLMDFANDYLGIGQSAELTMPAVFTAPTITDTMSVPTQTRDVGGLEDSLTSAITSAIIVALQSQGTQQGGETTVNLMLNETALGRAVIKFINNQIRQTGVNPINS